MPNEAHGFICPKCGHDRAFVVSLLRDKTGVVIGHELVCKRCEEFWRELT